jgi:PIN domain nuclease of toxin-antitoxin system
MGRGLVMANSISCFLVMCPVNRRAKCSNSPFSIQCTQNEYHWNSKYRIGKLPEAKQLVAQYPQVLNQAKLIELPITAAHGLRAGGLPILHRDPFDRTIMAQAKLEKVPVLTYDNAFLTGLIQVIS